MRRGSPRAWGKQDVAAVAHGVDSLRAGLVILGEARDVRVATTRARRLLGEYFDTGQNTNGALPRGLDAWVHRHQGGARDEPPVVPRPYVVDRGDRRLVVRLTGGPPRRLLMLSEERLAPDREALEALGLTRREAEVLTWLAAGKRDQEIATILAISPRTVHHHLQHIYDKLGVETRGAAIAIALRASSDLPPA